MAFEIGGPQSSGGDKFKNIRRRDALELAFGPTEKPHDLETERAVLAGILLSTEAFSDIQQVITADDFYYPAHKDIYNSMMQLGMKNSPIDITTISSYLRDHGQLEGVGGNAYITQIAVTPVTSLHATEYAKIVRDLSWRRKLLEAADLCKSAALKTGDTRDIAAEIEKIVFSTTQEKKTSKVIRLGELLQPAIQELEKRADNKGLPINGVRTGLKDVDECIMGFRPGQLIVLAAGPGAGKTSWAANIMYDGIVKQKKNVLFFSLEMTATEIVERILAQGAGVDSTKLRNGHLSAKDFNELFYAADALTNAPLFIDDRSVLTPYDVLGQARKLLSTLSLQGLRPELDLIVVDYIQIMKSGSNNENRALEVAAITGGLKAIAKELKVPVLALSQLNRDRSKRAATDARPQLSDLKDSGAIEADADVVMFIHRDQGPDTDSRAPCEAEIIIAKQRSGPTGTVKVTWLGALTKFSDYINPGMGSADYGQHNAESFSENQFAGPPDFEG